MINIDFFTAYDIHSKQPYFSSSLKIEFKGQKFYDFS
jgi:hypothetical protein